MIDRHVALASARLVVTGECGDAFEQSRFSGAVLTDDHRDLAIEREVEAAPQERQTKWITVRIEHPLCLEPHAPQIGRRQTDGARLPRHGKPPFVTGRS
jgi:hypothetical protein